MPVRFNNVYWFMTQMKDKSNMEDECGGKHVKARVQQRHKRDKTKLLTNVRNGFNSMKVILFRSAWVLVCVFVFCNICSQYVCLLCANVYACVRVCVCSCSVIFYRLVDKSVLFTLIAAAASKRADLQWWETHSKLCLTLAAEHGHSWEIIFTGCTLHILFPKV